jgi:hypothetical protein
LEVAGAPHARIPAGYRAVGRRRNGGNALAQLLLGIGTSVLLFLIAMRMTGRPSLAFAAGLSYDLNLRSYFSKQHS